MSDMSTYETDKPIKMLLMGESGAGKTGALCSLVDAGWKLKIVDYDNGLLPLANFVKNKKLLTNVEYETVTDKFRGGGIKVVLDGPPTAYQRGQALLTKWQAEDPKDTIVIVDGLSFMCEAAFRWVIRTSGREMTIPTQANWLEAQRMIEGTLAMLFCNEFQPHVIVLAHIKYVEDENMPTRGLPNALGRALPPTIGTYFNTCFAVRTRGSGDLIKRVIRTKSEGLIELKSPYPDLPIELPQETGLATLFVKTKHKTT